tara:strand:- start:6078 stop:6557 length:480 start_codon:yes stop_codon:yes gene_type:complete
MIKKIISFYVIVLFLIQCGFQPIYSEKNSIIENDYETVLISDNSIAVKEAFNSVFKNASKQSNYRLKLNIIEQDLPIVTNSDGTIAKYRIDISISFTLFDKLNGKEVFSDYSKGFAQYETQTNNYDTEQKREEAKKIATTNSLQLIPIKIQNFQSRADE